MAKGVGAMMAGGNPANGRQANEFYPTPTDVTLALIKAEGDRIPQSVWEPACGTGSMAEVLKGHSFNVVSSDLIDHGYGSSGVDFLSNNTNSPFGGNKFAIITNPPFKLARLFIERAHALECEYLALVLKQSYWSAFKSRGDLWKCCRPSRRYDLGWRPDFLNQGAPTMECMWCIWEPGKITTRTDFDILPPISR